MCSPAALAGTAAGASVGQGLFGLYGAYDQAAQARRQASLYGSQANALALQSQALQAQAASARAMGAYQGRLDTIRGAQTQQQAEANMSEAAKARQQFVGAGKTAFAANGVLLEGRPGSAVAMWEQDEAADLAYEQAMIKQNADNEIFGYLANAEMARAQGRMQAQAFMGESAAALMNAQTAKMQASMARASGRSAIISGWAGLLGAGSQGAGQAASIMMA